MFACYLHIPPSEVDAMAISDFEFLTGWIDEHEARLRAETTE
ncbi:hypothetical protein OHB04_22850 [Streptomyces sp. NBC_01775]|nr:hypothetical protein [Streptomyces sp. NBC_01775]WSB78334.1 hypothetical protein OHB04_22850 [Streptomyces sp. NBC_01775]